MGSNPTLSAKSIHNVLIELEFLSETPSVSNPVPGRAVRLAAIVLAASISIAHAEIRIENDPGGSLPAYRARVDAARASGERVVIDGKCFSACTLWLTLPRTQICATTRAVFGFHWVTDSRLGLPDRAATEALTDLYPEHVRRFIVGRGGLWLTPIFVRGNVLAPACN